MIFNRQTDDEFFRIALGIFKDKAVITKSVKQVNKKR